MKTKDLEDFFDGCSDEFIHRLNRHSVYAADVDESVVNSYMDLFEEHKQNIARIHVEFMVKMFSLLDRDTDAHIESLKNREKDSRDR